MKSLIERFEEKCEEVGELRGRLSMAEDRAREREYALRTEVERLSASSPRVSPATVSALIRGLRSGQKIAAIKAIREITGLGLKEAKDMFEASDHEGQDQLLRLPVDAA